MELGVRGVGNTIVPEALDIHCTRHDERQRFRKQIRYFMLRMFADTSSNRGTTSRSSHGGRKKRNQFSARLSSIHWVIFDHQTITSFPLSTSQSKVRCLKRMYLLALPAVLIISPQDLLSIATWSASVIS